MTTLEQPKQGQFVAVWMYNNLLWSAAFKYDDRGRLLVYQMGEDVDTEDGWVLNGGNQAVPPWSNLIAYHTM